MIHLALAMIAVQAADYGTHLLVPEAEINPIVVALGPWAGLAKAGAVVFLLLAAWAQRSHRRARAVLAVGLIAGVVGACSNVTALASRSALQPAPTSVTAAGYEKADDPIPSVATGARSPAPLPVVVVPSGAPIRDVPIASVPALSGIASWYPASGLIAAAGPALRTGDWRGRWVVVTVSGDTWTRAVRVQLTDWCQCYGTRLIDLSDDAFARLAPLSRGVLRVTVG